MKYHSTGLFMLRCFNNGWDKNIMKNRLRENEVLPDEESEALASSSEEVWSLATRLGLFCLLFWLESLPDALRKWSTNRLAAKNKITGHLKTCSDILAMCYWGGFISRSEGQVRLRYIITDKTGGCQVFRQTEDWRIKETRILEIGKSEDRGRKASELS